MYRASFIIFYYNQQMHIYFTNYHTPTCFDTIVSKHGACNQYVAKLHTSISNTAIGNTIYNLDVSHRFYASSHIIVVEISIL